LGILMSDLLCLCRILEITAYQTVRGLLCVEYYLRLRQVCE
jgi:hypothetical protein